MTAAGAMTPHERDQLGVEFPDMLPPQVAVGIIADDDFGYSERRRGRTDFERPRAVQRLVSSGVDRPAAFAMRRATTRRRETPSAARRASVPPHASDSSSGCAKTARIESAGKRRVDHHRPAAA